MAVRGALREYRFLKLQNAVVESVIFGCKCPEADRKQILKILDTDGFKHVKTYETTMSDADYRIEMVERARNGQGDCMSNWRRGYRQWRWVSGGWVRWRRSKLEQGIPPVADVFSEVQPFPS
jgi:hypothetical protein